AAPAALSKLPAPGARCARRAVRVPFVELCAGRTPIASVSAHNWTRGTHKLGLVGLVWLVVLVGLVGLVVLAPGRRAGLIPEALVSGARPALGAGPATGTAATVDGLLRHPTAALPLELGGWGRRCSPGQLCAPRTRAHQAG
ncbi:MAG: hypothetical protein ACYDAQ_19340, partial [Mycobacteriales bacterium]